MGNTNVIEIDDLLFPDFGKCRPSMKNWFFPSSDVTTALKNGALYLKNFERAHDVTWLEFVRLCLPKPGYSKPSSSIMLGNTMSKIVQGMDTTFFPMMTFKNSQIISVNVPKLGQNLITLLPNCIIQPQPNLMLPKCRYNTILIKSCNTVAQLYP